jgi:hypothetical protein
VLGAHGLRTSVRLKTGGHVTKNVTLACPDQPTATPSELPTPSDTPTPDPSDSATPTETTGTGGG